MMRVFSLAATAAVAVAQVNSIVTDASLEALQGVDHQCVGSTMQSVEYDVVHAESTKFVNLDHMPVHKVTCDLDHTEMWIELHNSMEAVEWLAKFHGFNQHIIVGGARWNCGEIAKAPNMVLRRVFSTSQSEHLGKTLHVKTSMVRYDEIYSSANINLHTYHQHPTCVAAQAAAARGVTSLPKSLCLVYNVDCHQTTAKAVIPIFKNDHIAIDCKNCFAQVTADIVTEIHIHDFKLQSARVGFENIVLNATAIFEVTASGEKTLTTIEKNLPILDTTTVLAFQIGVVPFVLTVGVPMKFDATFNLEADVAVDFGVQGGVTFPSLDLRYDQAHHWHINTPAAVVGFAPVVTKSAGLDVSADFALTPSINVDFARMFHYELDVRPTFHADVAKQSDAKAVCANANYDLEISQFAELQINVPLLNIHKDYKYGPESLLSKKGNLREKCFNL